VSVYLLPHINNIRLRRAVKDQSGLSGFPASCCYHSPVDAARAGTAAIDQPPGLPALARLRHAVQTEQQQCWLLVAILALTLIPVSFYSVASIAFLFVAVSGLAQQTDLPRALQSLAQLTGIAAQTGAALICGSIALAAPATAVILAVTTYNRQRRLVVRDLVWGPVALMLMEAEYAELIEQAAAERYRPNPNRVNLKPDFLSRINHFAHYYAVYYRMSYGPAEPRVPLTIERNCWLEGLLTCFAGCFGGCGVAGGCLIAPLIFRICISWPKLVATKQAVLEFFSGTHDDELLMTHP